MFSYQKNIDTDIVLIKCNGSTKIAGPPGHLPDQGVEMRNCAALCVCVDHSELYIRRKVRRGNNNLKQTNLVSGFSLLNFKQTTWISILYIMCQHFSYVELLHQRNPKKKALMSSSMLISQFSHRSLCSISPTMSIPVPSSTLKETKQQKIQTDYSFFSPALNLTTFMVPKLTNVQHRSTRGHHISAIFKKAKLQCSEF